MSLRARLLAGMAALVAVGLGVAALVTYEEQRSFLMSRVEQQVESALGPVSFQLRALPGRRAGATGAGTPPSGTGTGAGAAARRFDLRRTTALPPGTFGEVLGPTGAVLDRRTFSYGEGTPAYPAIPVDLLITRSGRPTRFFTLRSGGASSTRYRAAAFAIGGDTIVVAVPLREVDDTLHRLVIVELLVGIGVILALVALGRLVIGLGLRPLERIGRVASEIAGGDLSRRVTETDSRTEVGRLGQSLNDMLAQIERAFADRSQSEDRLRRFLADASHELRTPLASIRGYAELFRLGLADDPATLERAMNRIEAEATRMGVLVEDLLLLAQLDQAPEPRRSSVDLRELVEHAAADARVLAPDREITVTAGDRAVVLGDADQLRQLLANLMRNAVIHTPDGIPIELSCGVGDRGRGQIIVRDHGPGLPADAGDQIFERFWRSETGRRRGRGGAGLGLAIVRAVVAAHAGDVRAENMVDGGVRFVVTFPLADRANPSQETLSLLTSGSYLRPAQ